ncbi:MAG: ABC transporter ATP-binding protein [Deltaproteobacteria bacterium]|uniref:ABC transporter ATP-binding protein n=1 Tax=Candidatus Zymogenus saltonus TaxID=2844893 RepID=A0A9D8KGN5_9DELT|nr:ABC transporter ATP-binding protein [Candidatus Zymogenus saltonus]
MILKVINLSINFGGVKALQKVSFSVRDGEVKAVIGPNGAGKTTLFNLITGIFPPTSGKILLDDIRIDGRKSNKIASMGITRTFQNLEIFDNMTVLENVMVGRHLKSSSGFLECAFRAPTAVKEERKIAETSLKYLDFVGLEPRANDISTSLPLGHQRYLEIARALASEPRLILLDEPAAGLDERETEDLLQLIRKISENGITVLLVEHDMGLTMEISDDIIVLDHGELIAEGTPREIQYNKNVIEAYLGEDVVFT